MTRTERVARARELLGDAYEKRGWLLSAAEIRRGEKTGEEDSAPMLAVLAALTAIDEERDALFDAIKHGDADHQAWLKEAIDAHFAGQPVPEPRGKGRKEAERDALREALAKCHDRFRHYEQMHRLKYSADGNEKADRNREMAEMCEAALARSLSLVSREEN